MEIIERAVKEGRSNLSEYESKKLISRYGIRVTQEILITEREEIPTSIRQIGFPAAMKGCSSTIAHKTEKDLIRLNIRSEEEALNAFNDICVQMGDEGDGVLVQEMIRGNRELVLGVTRDPQFGACVMFGLGGVFTEVLHDVVFRKAPLDRLDAMEMMREIRGHKILDAVRGMAAANTDKIADMIVAVGQIAHDYACIQEIDINPVIITGDGQPVAVDALVVIK